MLIARSSARRPTIVGERGRFLSGGEGEIVEAGSFEDVVARDGVFARSARAHFMVFEESAAAQ